MMRTTTKARIVATASCRGWRSLRGHAGRSRARNPILLSATAACTALVGMKVLRWLRALDLRGRVALVTGGTRGLGFAPVTGSESENAVTRSFLAALSQRAMRRYLQLGAQSEPGSPLSRQPHEGLQQVGA